MENRSFWKARFVVLQPYILIGAAYRFALKISVLAWRLVEKCRLKYLSIIILFQYIFSTTASRMFVLLALPMPGGYYACTSDKHWWCCSPFIKVVKNNQTCLPVEYSRTFFTAYLFGLLLLVLFSNWQKLADCCLLKKLLESESDHDIKVSVKAGKECVIFSRVSWWGQSFHCVAFIL